MRDYAQAERALTQIDPATHDRHARMRACCDAIWNHARGSTRPVSWVGFYAITPDASQMVLLERRDSPACSPIALHGACGRAWRDRSTLIVRDIHALGEHYIACDPRDASELVIPCMESDGSCWGVLDLDSHAVDAFDEHDARSLHSLLVASALTSGGLPPLVCL